MPELVPFTADHMAQIAPTDGSTPEMAEAKAQGGPAYTMVHDGAVLGCGGLFLVWPGVAIAWLVLTPGASRWPVWIVRQSRRFFREQIRSHQLHRIEMAAAVDNPRAHRWAESCGFTRETTCARRYTPDQRDVIRLEWYAGAPAQP